MEKPADWETFKEKLAEFEDSGKLLVQKPRTLCVIYGLCEIILVRGLLLYLKSSI
jgi:hypothetical protein